MDIKKEKNTINGLYFTLILATILSFVPNLLAQSFSIILLLVTLIAAYYYKALAPKEGLVYNHMTYMIGTIWLGSIIIFIGMVLAGLWVYQDGDHTIVHNIVAQVQGGQVPTETGMRAALYSYMDTNKDLLIRSSIITIGPGVLYVVYRVANGLARAIKGYRIAKPTSWL